VANVLDNMKSSNDTQQLSTKFLLHKPKYSRS
jgi:hypothetical protein